jgi:hypothetical protein
VVQGLHQRLRHINSAHIKPGFLESLIAKPRSLANSRCRSQRPNDDQGRARSCIRRGLRCRDRAGCSQDLASQSVGQPLPDRAMKDLLQRIQPAPSRHGATASGLAERRSIPARWRAGIGPRKGTCLQEQLRQPILPTRRRQRFLITIIECRLSRPIRRTVVESCHSTTEVYFGAPNP